MNARSILDDRSLEITTSAALMVNYLLGVLVGLDHIFTPVAGAIVMHHLRLTFSPYRSQALETANALGEAGAGRRRRETRKDRARQQSR